MRKPQNLTNTRQYGKTLKSRIYSYQIARRPSGTRKLETNYSCSQNFKKSNRNKTLSISDKISQADQHAKALQKLSKLKNKFRQSAVRQTFQTNLDNFYYLLKDERVLFFYLLHSLSRTSRLKIQKLCHNPTKTTKCPQLSRQLMTSRCNRNTVHALTTYPTDPKFSKAIILKLSQKTTP